MNAAPSARRFQQRLERIDRDVVQIRCEGTNGAAAMADHDDEQAGTSEQSRARVRRPAPRAEKARRADARCESLQEREDQPEEQHGVDAGHGEHEPGRRSPFCHRAGRRAA